MSDLTHPGAVMQRLVEIEADLAARQQILERSAMKWFQTKRDREREYAEAFLAAEGTVDQRKAHAAIHASTLGKEVEAEYEAVKAVVRVLETRASIGQSLLRSQSRNESPVQPQWSNAA